ncbi:MAG: bifunctional diguanylate cyclase/phosphodiesterase [Candidatus Pelethousia sp.]|nr:bifunctional diguanylate cyclase/phosphodiesterase [Candidatus Pelethousia sp.]
MGELQNDLRSGLDDLTGLPNRYSFEATMCRLQGEAGYALLLDIDDFKAINQCFGYNVGDTLIVSLARYLRSALTPDYQLFRMNGDTFAALVCAGVSSERLTEDMKAVLRRCGSPWKIGNRVVFCTVSIAAVSYSSNGADVEEIYQRLNDALYQARKGGKNHFAIYNEAIEHVANLVIKRRALEGLLWKAVDENFLGFHLHYQPIVCSVTERILGAEALLRFTTKEGQAIPPLSFIPLVEQNGLILPIGCYVLNTAVCFCKTMIDAGYADFCVNINISIRQLENPCFAQTVFDILHKTGVPCPNIILEITESMAATSIERIQHTCKRLLDAGVHIALDDFGTGYSSLNMLRTMPFDRIKIDRSFINDMLVDEYADSFIRLITELKNVLGVAMCAEGVEEQAQLSRCRELGIDFIQGYIYHKAMPGQDLLRLMQANDTG